MALEYLNDTSQRAFRKLERDLLLQNSNLNMQKYKSMTPRRLGKVIESLDKQMNTVIRESKYGSWLSDDKYVQKRLLHDALSYLKEYKESCKDSEKIIPGFTYYRRVKQFGPMLIGERCFVREHANPLWAEFKIPLTVAKAFEVMRHGDESDFKKIYIEMANGRIDALERVSLEHLTESSKDALAEIEKYCDARWEGPWPWEIPTPYTLRENIEERLQMTYNNIRQMQADFGKIVVRLNEDEMDKYEVIASAEEMSKKIEGMVQDIARLAGEGIIKLKDQIRVTMGDESADQIEDEFVEPVRHAADALSKLRATIDQTVENLKSEGDVSMDGGLDGGLGGGMGDDDLGGEIGGDDEVGDLADVSVDGEPEERPMKQM